MCDEGVTGLMEKRGKIIHIIGGGEFGGAEQHILSLLEYIEGQQEIEAEVVTFYDGLLAKKLRERGNRVTIIPQTGRFDLKLYAHLVRLFMEKRPDLIHTHGVRANFFSRLAGRRAHVPHIVTTVHSILKHDYPKAGEFLIARWMEKATLAYTEAFIAVSSAVKEDLRRFGVEAERIHVIHNGIHTEEYAPTPALFEERKKIRHEWGIADEELLLLTVARLVPVKGLKGLIEGFAKAYQEIPRLRLAIIGEGPERRPLESIAQALGVGDHVIFAGFRQDIPALLASADLYLNTSLSEGLPLSLMEAMAAEKPVIVTEVGGMREMVKHEQTGLFIPPNSPEKVADAILRLARDEALRQNLGVQGRIYAQKHFSVTAMGEATLHFYQSLIKG